MDSTGIPDDPLSRFALAIFRVNGLLMRNGDRLTGQIGQSSARWQVLGRVGYKPHTVAEMARDMGHARQSVQRVADELAKEGLVSYKPSPNDRRTQLVELTPQGMDVLMAIYALQEAWAQNIMTKLDADQLGSIADALEAIADIVEADEEQASQANQPHTKGKT